MDKARELLLRGTQLSALTGHNASVIYIKASLARLLQTEGNLDLAIKTASEAAESLGTGVPDWVRPDLFARQASLLLARGDLSAAEAVLRQSGVLAEDPVTERTEVLHLAWQRLLLQQGQGISLARRIIDETETSQRYGTLAQALVLGALAARNTDSTTSHAWLGRALELAEPEGCLRVFLDEGAPMAALLQGFDHMPYVQNLLRFFPHSPLPAGGETLIVALTERELEVLRLMAGGLKYSEIAERLVVSVNTIRFHIKGIYGKLGVTKLTQAIERGAS